MTGCEEYELLLSVQLDQALSPQEQETLSAHLATCPHCRALAEELALLHEASDDLSLEPPAHLRDQIMAQVALEPRCVVPARQPRPRRWNWALAGAAVLTLVVAGSLRLLPLPADEGEATAAQSENTAPSYHAPIEEKSTDTPPVQEDEACPETAPADNSGNSASDHTEPAAPPVSPPEPRLQTAPPETAPEAMAPANIQEEITTANDGNLPQAAGGATPFTALALSQEEALVRLTAYLDREGIAYTTLDYLGVSSGEEGHLFTLTDPQGQTSTYWVSLEDERVSLVTNMDQAPDQ